MTIQMLEKERNLARINGQNERLLVLNDIIGNIRRKEAGKSGATERVQITEKLVSDTLVEYRKMLKDGINQMPEGHAVRTAYEAQKKIVEEFCPPIVEDENEIKEMITNLLTSNQVEPNKKNRGRMMKVLMPVFRTLYVDMDVAMPIIETMIEETE